MFANYLNFKNGTRPGMVTISEPVGSDNEILSTETEFFAADLQYGNQEQSLVFWRGVFEQSQQVKVLPNGTVYYFNDMCYEWLVEYDRLYGGNADVERIVEYGGTSFVVGRIDFGTIEITDRYVSCRVIMDTKRTVMRDEADTKVDILGTEDLYGNTIKAAQLEYVLLPAIPLQQVSDWKQDKPHILFAGYRQYFNLAAQNAGGIDDSLVPPYAVDNLGWTYPFVVNNFKYVRAVQDLSNVKLTIDLNYTFYYRFTTGYGYGPEAKIYCEVTIAPEPFVVDNSIYNQTIYSKSIADGINQDYDEALTLTVDLPNVPRGYCIYVYWGLKHSKGHLGTTTAEGAPFSDFLFFLLNGGNLAAAVAHLHSGTGAFHDRTAWLINDQSMHITARATGIDSVAPAVRWLTAGQQVAKVLGGNDVQSVRWANGGEHWDNHLINGWGLRGFTDKPFYLTWNTWLRSIREVCGDAFIGRDRTFVGQFEDFFADVDLGGFLESPYEDTATVPVPFFQLKLLTLGYEKFETNDKDGDKYIRNTSQGVHTENQRRFAITSWKDQLDVKLPFTRDPFYIENIRQQSIVALPEVALSSDDETVIVNTQPIPPNTRGRLNQKLAVQVNGDNTIYVKNKALGDDGNASTDPVFGWTTLGGFAQNDQVEIVDGINGFGLHGLIGTWTVTEVSVSQVTLAPVTTIAAVLDGDVYLVIDFPYTQVSYIARTSQGIETQGIANGDRMYNLAYSIRQNLLCWQGFLEAVNFRSADSPIRSQYYKNNGQAGIKVQGQDRFYVENEDIVTTGDAIVFGKAERVRFQIPFDRMLRLFEDSAATFGFIRVKGVDGKVRRVHLNCPKQVTKYGWFSQTFEGVLLRRAEPDTVTIIKTDAGITVNGAAYVRGSLASQDWFRITTAGYVTLFDGRQVELFTAVLFHEIEVDGVKYDDENEFKAAMLALFG